jgi:hypothetical protein
MPAIVKLLVTRENGTAFVSKHLSGYYSSRVVRTGALVGVDT